MKTPKYYLPLAALLFCAAVIVLASCSKETNDPYRGELLDLPATPYDYSNVAAPLSDIFTDPFILNANADITDEGATLGRVLFYDNKLSLNNKVSCGTCHQQNLAFSDDVSLSDGFDNRKTTRNTQAIINPITETSFFWDSRETHLPDMVLKPIKNHIEMGIENLDDLEVKLSAASYYAPLFEAAYGSPEVTQERIGDAMSQFLFSMVTANSRWDQGLHNNFANYTAAEELGKSVFFDKARCYQCHNGADFRGYIEDFANIGLEMEYTDPGLGATDPGREGVFKVPSLRNVGLTGPYMHDGRFQTLMEVVEHYNSGVANHPNLDPRLRDWQDGEVFPLNLTNAEKEGLVAFLLTLSDADLVSDVKYSNPFR